MQTSIIVWFISTLNLFIKVKGLDRLVILNYSTRTDCKSGRDRQVTICCHINHIWLNELNIVKDPVMAHNDMKSCRKVQMDTRLVSSVRFQFNFVNYCLGSTENYLILYIRGSIVTLECVCYKVVCWDSLHIRKAERTRAKGWTVFTARLTNSELMAPPCLSAAMQ